MVDHNATRYDVVIVGGGHAGVQLAANLAKAKYSGSIALLSDERVLPYERPPLSKGFLKGLMAQEELYLRKPEYWEKSPVDVVLGFRVEEVVTSEKLVRSTEGAEIGYNQLVWAAGGHARELPLPGSDSENVHTVRTLSDVAAMQTQLHDAKKAVIIGGGYIGLETGAVLRTLGLEVTVVEALDRLLARVTSEVISDHVLELHKKNGVEVILGSGVSKLVATDSRVTEIELSDGRRLPADIVVVGIGLVPNVEPLAAAGADIANGVQIDEHCRTSLPDVFAVGDCASFANRYTRGNRVRLESVQNATEQAKTAAQNIAGHDSAYEIVPWFWSDQYDMKLKTAGLLAGHDTVLVRGEAGSNAFSVLYLEGRRLLAIDAVDRLGDFTQAKTLISQGVELDLERAADEGIPLKESVDEATAAQELAVSREVNG